MLKLVRMYTIVIEWQNAHGKVPLGRDLQTRIETSLSKLVSYQPRHVIKVKLVSNEGSFSPRTAKVFKEQSRSWQPMIPFAKVYSVLV